MIFDELLGNVEASILSDDAYNKEPLVVPHPSPDAKLQNKPKKGFLSPKRFKEWTRLSPSEMSPPIEFAFPTVTQEGRAGRAPVKSPASSSPWKSSIIVGDPLSKSSINLLRDSSENEGNDVLSSDCSLEELKAKYCKCVLKKSICN